MGLVDTLLRWWYGPARKKLRVMRVMVFDTQDRLDYVAWDPASFEGHAWVTHVRKITQRDPARLEIRLRDGQRKRRIVLYPGMPCDPSFPPLARNFVISAVLMPREGAEPVDVTSRVQKYVGNALRSAMHMFPFDDPDALCQRFSGIKMVDFTMSVVDAPFSCDGGKERIGG